ncbi:hypothetical protein GA0004736_2044 [Curtobacterium sp. 9128]|uniref:hypothetical protein n=1 Tax=Curtobacterium sp. 9128 TaxID=1793722 RepID=UPI0007D72166|nr:hypothetical protein [Curtobacterium sp. 9128]SBN63124.1 hypothetical protein GA0004736_2044 [Curtobacterium sp. 9128]
MAGDLRLEESGLSSLVRELQVRGASSDEHAADVDAALAAAAGATSTPQLAGAMQRLAGRFRGTADDVGARMTSLGSSLTTAAQAIVNTDTTLAGSARELGR